MKTADLSALDFIKIDTVIPESYYPYLTELAKIKPGIGLYYESDISDISGIDKTCLTRGILLVESYMAAILIFFHLSQILKFWSYSWMILSSTGPLPSMPKLKHLFLTKVSDKVIQDDKFLSAKQNAGKHHNFGIRQN